MKYQNCLVAEGWLDEFFNVVPARFELTNNDTGDDESRAYQR
ncbi:hypothetical protein [Sphingomonas sp. NPDC079357]|jgi:hypothetical protein